MSEGIVMSNSFCKIKALNQIGYLESQQLKDGYEFHFSLFFNSKISERKRLLDNGNLILYTYNGHISIGNLENVTDKYNKLSFNEFTDLIKAT